MKYPIGIQSFEKIRKEGFVYVDKTDLVYKMVQGHGTRAYIFVFEFKLDGTADEAVRQITDRGYAKAYEADHSPCFLVGASFSSKTGTIEDWKDITN